MDRKDDRWTQSARKFGGMVLFILLILVMVLQLIHISKCMKIYTICSTYCILNHASIKYLKSMEYATINLLKKNLQWEVMGGEVPKKKT